MPPSSGPCRANRGARLSEVGADRAHCGSLKEVIKNWRENYRNRIHEAQFCQFREAVRYDHAYVLAGIASKPAARLRDIAATVGITERTVAAIVNDVEEAGDATRTRVGRNKRYEVPRATRPF